MSDSLLTCITTNVLLDSGYANEIFNISDTYFNNWLFLPVNDTLYMAN